MCPELVASSWPRRWFSRWFPRALQHPSTAGGLAFVSIPMQHAGGRPSHESSTSRYGPSAEPPHPGCRQQRSVPGTLQFQQSRAPSRLVHRRSDFQRGRPPRVRPIQAQRARTSARRSRSAKARRESSQRSSGRRNSRSSRSSTVVYCSLTDIFTGVSAGFLSGRALSGTRSSGPTA